MASANPYRERPRPNVESLMFGASPEWNGGLEATPIEFDDAIIHEPVIYGELMPLVRDVSKFLPKKPFTTENPAKNS